MVVSLGVVSCELDVVEADHGNVLRHFQIGIPQDSTVEREEFGRRNMSSRRWIMSSMQLARSKPEKSGRSRKRLLKPVSHNPFCKLSLSPPSSPFLLASEPAGNLELFLLFSLLQTNLWTDLAPAAV